MNSSDSHTFQVDLRGLVDLLSHHLYSSPRVYIRELLQNGVDAITARRHDDPDAPGEVRITVSDSGLRITDSGIGLTADQMHELLATIGRSSKRDGLEETRKDFLGRFGIGLLACFVVASQITVVSRSATPGATPVKWVAHDDGTYRVTELSADAHPEPGTTVEVSPRSAQRAWVAPDRVKELAVEFGSLLPFSVTVDGEEITERPPVWERPHPTQTARRIALNAYCEQTLGFTPLDVIDIDLPEHGMRGAVFVLPNATSPTHQVAHRVYLKGMLLTDTATNLLPGWAFFARVVVDTTNLRPTASRENIFEDSALAEVQEALGGRIRDWLTTVAVTEPHRIAAFLTVHHLGVKALARHDDELLSIMLPWLQFETSDGRISLADFARTHSSFYVTETVEEFRQIAPIATAQGIGVLNGGYTYDLDLAHALPRLMPGVSVSNLDSDVVAQSLDVVDPTDATSLAELMEVARARMDAADCDVELRRFYPLTVPALLLDDREAQHARESAKAQEEADDIWGGILAALHNGAPRARLVLNQLNPLVNRISALPDAELMGVAVDSVYGQALLLSQRPLKPADSALLNRSFMDLLQWITREDKGGY